MILSNKMAATSSELSTCPFCSLSFKKLGSHLSLCKLRDGRDYEHLLSAKTLANRTTSKRKGCPRCNKYFVRLDTHLRLSRSCQVPRTPPNAVLQHQQDSPPQPPQPHPSPQPHVSVPLVATQLPALKLPESAEEWSEVDRVLAESVVPAVLAATTVDDKNDALCQGIYQLFANQFGCASPHKPR